MSAASSLQDLLVEGRPAPLGIDVARPRFSWHLIGVRDQVGYEVEVDNAAGTAVWRSGTTPGSTPFGIEYAGPQLASRTAFVWRARAQVDDGSWTGWATSRFETGLRAEDWRATWLAGPAASTTAPAASLHLLGGFALPAHAARARAYASGLGWYSLSINGAEVTGTALVPRWTDFDQVVEYQAYDVTELLHEGENTVAVVVGEGRFRGALGHAGRTGVYGSRLAAIVQIEVLLADGSTVVIGSDSTWRGVAGPELRADPKLGARVDLRRSGPSDRLDEGSPAAVLPEHPRRLIAESVQRVQAIERIPVTISRTPSGQQLVDVGRVIAGVLHLRVSGPAGRRVRLDYSEVLLPDGELDRNYLLPKRTQHPDEDWFQHDEVLLDGTDQWFQAPHTIHGFRYVAVQGLDRDLQAGDVEAVVFSTDLAITAEFRCSDPRLEQLHCNAVASLRGNFTDTATDCPTRERAGWTGDIQVFGPTATLLADSGPFLARYLENVTREQYPDGRIPPFIPSEASDHLKDPADAFFKLLGTSVGWGDVAVLLPWTIYTHLGDERVLRQSWDAAQAWVDQCARRARRRGSGRWFSRRIGPLERFVLDQGFHWGEWLRPGEVASQQFVPNYFTRASIATAYLARSSDVLARIAEVIGRDADARRYRVLAERVTQAYLAAFVHPDGRIGEDRQDEYVRALAFDLLPPERRAQAVARLVELIEEADDHLDTGFLSTPLLLPVLAEHGRADLAYRILLQPTAPSWIAQIERGATSMWETWTGYHPDGTARESHNHYAFGSVASWLHSGIAGLRPDAPGWRRAVLEPHPGGGLTSASSRLTTPFGVIGAAWRVEGTELVVEADVPANVDLRLRVSGREIPLRAGHHVRRLPRSGDDRTLGRTA